MKCARIWGMVATASVALFVAPALAAGAEGNAQIAPPGCSYGSPHPDAPPELAQFDFLIGDFTIAAHARRNGVWSPPRPGPTARWNGRYILGGMVIMDEWYDPDPGFDPSSPRGVNVRRWNEGPDEWDMMWVHTGGFQVQDLRAKILDGKLTMWQVYPERPNFRAYFERLGPDSWQRIALAPDEAGEWQPTFKLVATRIPCD